MKTRNPPTLSVGDTCRIQNKADRFHRKWDKTDHHQYIIKVSGSGRLNLQNQKYLQKIQPLSQLQLQPFTPIKQQAAPAVFSQSFQQKVQQPIQQTPVTETPSHSMTLPQSEQCELPEVHIPAEP